MIYEVMPGLFVGDDWGYKTLFMSKRGRAENVEMFNYKIDLDKIQVPGYAIVHAAKEPWHRAFVSYSGRGCPKGNPEYLFAERGCRLALNLVDAPDPKFFSREIFVIALNFIEKQLNSGKKVLVHCNEGKSRSPSIALLYMANKSLIKLSFPDAGQSFKRIYPLYDPGDGITKHLIYNWDFYITLRL
jgi:hypothetical protein